MIFIQHLIIYFYIYRSIIGMSNLNGQPATMQAMQAYITELAAYINENNDKYTRNLQALKQFYEQQINELNQTIIQNEDDILMLKNQNITCRDLLQNRSTEISQLQQKIEQLKLQIHELEEKNKGEKDRNEQTYQHMDQLRQDMQTQIDKAVLKARQIEQDKTKIELDLKQKLAQIRMQKDEISILEQKVAERYTLPERMKDLEIQSARDRENIANLQTKVTQAIKERDYAQTELQRKRKQVEKLTIQANKSKGDQSFEIEQALKKQRTRFTDQIQNLKLENERKVFQIKDFEIKLKQKSHECSKLQNIVAQVEQLKRKMQEEIKELKEDKIVYLTEFRKLKGQYDEVINNLQNAIPEYQKKNWTLEQENQDLNTQLDGLQELLRELRAMNDMQPTRKEYRQWAQLNLAAEKRLPQQKQTTKPQKSYLIRQNQNDVSPDWDKLMLEIDNIQI